MFFSKFWIRYFLFSSFRSWGIRSTCSKDTSSFLPRSIESTWKFTKIERNRLLGWCIHHLDCWIQSKHATCFNQLDEPLATSKVCIPLSFVASILPNLVVTYFEILKFTVKAYNTFSLLRWVVSSLISLTPDTRGESIFHNWIKRNTVLHQKFLILSSKSQFQLGSDDTGVYAFNSQFIK